MDRQTDRHTQTSMMTTVTLVHMRRALMTLLHVAALHAWHCCERSILLALEFALLMLS